jgi:hypothetical protein
VITAVYKRVSLYFILIMMSSCTESDDFSSSCGIVSYLKERYPNGSQWNIQAGLECRNDTSYRLLTYSASQNKVILSVGTNQVTLSLDQTQNGCETQHHSEFWVDGARQNRGEFTFNEFETIFYYGPVGTSHFGSSISCSNLLLVL